MTSRGQAAYVGSYRLFPKHVARRHYTLDTPPVPAAALPRMGESFRLNGREEGIPQGGLPLSTQGSHCRALLL
jgi:hypothetical protein